jgi:hypothetical protein
VVEITGVVVVALSILLGLVNMPFALVFAGVAFGYGMFVSVSALAVEEFSFHRYRRWRDLLVAVGAAVFENIGYRSSTPGGASKASGASSAGATTAGA